MNNQQYIKGILGAIDEKLGTGIFRAEGRSLAGSGAKLIGRSPVKGILSRELAKEEVHPDIWDAAFGEPLPEGYAPLYRGFHGTNTRTPFDRPAANLKDIGISLTPSPSVSDFHSIGRHDLNADFGLEGPPVGSPGPRVYPLLADPGRPFKFPRDTQDWSDPENVYQKTINDPRYDPTQPDMAGVMKDLRRGHRLDESLADWGYHSIEYPHIDPWRFSKGKIFNDPSDFTAKGLTVFDPKRVVPEFSEVGQKAAKARGVLATEPSSKPKATSEDFTKLYGGKFPNNKPKMSPDEFIDHMYNVNTSKVGLLEHLGSVVSLVKPGPEYDMVIDKVRQYLKTMSPGAVQSSLQNLGYIRGSAKYLMETKKRSPGQISPEKAKENYKRADELMRIHRQELKTR